MALFSVMGYALGDALSISEEWIIWLKTCLDSEYPLFVKAIWLSEAFSIGEESKDAAQGTVVGRPFVSPLFRSMATRIAVEAI